PSHQRPRSEYQLMNQPDDFLRDRMGPLSPGVPQPPSSYPHTGYPRPPVAAAGQPPPVAGPPGAPWGLPDFQAAPAAPRRPQPARGWRRALLRATFGLVNLGPSRAERQEAEFTAVIQSVARSNFKV